MHVSLPPLFDRIPSTLFAPLAGVYAPLCFGVLGRLYQLEFESEPAYLLRETAHEVAARALVDSPLWI